MTTSSATALLTARRCPFIFGAGTLPDSVGDITVTPSIEYFRAHSNLNDFDFENWKFQALLNKTWALLDPTAPRRPSRMKKPSRMTRTAWIIAAGALGAALSGPAEAATQAGVSAAVRGQVEVYAIDDDTGRQANSGEDIFLGDEIASYEDAGMQLMLLDETIFTIGADTDITIDDFVYDPATGAGEVAASVTKGVFRFVTGNIAQGDPEDMTVDLPVGTIGIRGTIGMAHFIDGHWVIVLLGPGVGNNADERAGALSVSAQGQTVDLTRARYGTIIEPGLPPAPPFLFSAAQIRRHPRRPRLAAVEADARRPE